MPARKPPQLSSPSGARPSSGAGRQDGSRLAASALPATTETLLAWGAQVRKPVPCAETAAPMGLAVVTRLTSTGMSASGSRLGEMAAFEIGYGRFGFGPAGAGALAA